MALTVNHPLLKEQTIHAHTPSVATTPVAAVARAPFRGKVVKAGCMINAAISGADASFAVVIDGVTVSGSPFTVASTSSAAGSIGSFVPTGLNTVNEDSSIVFTPSGATGTLVTGTCFAVIQAG